MNLNHLRIFFFCCKHQTFSAAAEALFITQPAVTKQIRQMEADLGIDLFHRQVKKIHLTESGRILFECAQKIFELVESADDIVDKLKKLKIGELRIGTLQSYAAFLLPPLISSYLEKYPGIRVSVDEGSLADITRTLINHDNELGILPIKPLAFPQLEVIPYFQDEFLLALASGHPLNKKRRIYLRDLTGESLIVKAKSVTREIVLARYQEAGIELPALIESQSFALLLSQVQAGKGISFISKAVLKNQLIRRGTINFRSLAEGPLLTKINIAYLKNRALSPPAQAFMDLLKERKNARISAKSVDLSEKR